MWRQITAAETLNRKYPLLRATGARDFESGGREFESLRARQHFQCFIDFFKISAYRRPTKSKRLVSAVAVV